MANTQEKGMKHKLGLFFSGQECFFKDTAGSFELTIELDKITIKLTPSHSSLLRNLKPEQRVRSHGG